MLSIKLINSFRDDVSENNWVFFKYKNVGDKNKWNCICSAMDWIQIAVEYLIAHPFTLINSYNSIGVFANISCVSMIVEAVEQLHRVFFDTNELLFKSNRDCFSDNPFNQTDKEYFETIRSCFGAHPINLKDPLKPQDKEARRFASWSGGYFGMDDFSVHLYSNSVGTESIQLGMKFSQLDAFVEKYYSYLSDIAIEIEEQYDRFCEEKRCEVIEYTNDVEMIHILLSENEKRLNNVVYRCDLEIMQMIMETPITSESNRSLVEEFRSSLTPLIKEIHSNLQNMNIIDLQYDYILSPTPSTLKNGWGYALEKLNDAVFHEESLLFVCDSMINKYFGEYFTYEFSNSKELYVLVHAALFRLLRLENEQKV